ncbi:hypothetical protein PRIPAC_70077, partial [Pristionchus pacificus]|uniref:Uncharacterized protein n=1 Tax=Pristionchus pacificus TaxID=54126 RepID=A0A2A6C845_PRIPA
NLDKSWKDYLVGWRDQGLSLEEMSSRCKAMGHICSPSSIKRLLDLPLEIIKAPYSPRPSTIPPELYDDVRTTIIDLYKDDDEITMTSLLLKIEEKFNLHLSDYPIERIRKESGFVNLNVRHGHSVKLVNRQPRVDWCQARITEECSFRRHVFTDESMVQLDPNSRKVWVLSTARERRIKSAFKFPQKVLIWGGISWKGVTHLVIMHESCRIDAPEYCRILRDGYLKWERITEEDLYSCRIMRVVIPPRSLRTSSLEKRSRPAESPDLNPVELVWGDMKTYLKNHWKPTSVQHLTDGINYYWYNILTTEKCRQYIRHIHTQMRRVIEVDGGPVRE